MSSPPSSSLCAVVKTGREVDSIVFHLLTHADDKDDAVRTQITFSLHSLGLAEPLLVLSSICCFLLKNSKLSQHHRVLLVRQLNQLLETQNAREALAEAQASEREEESGLVKSVVEFCAKEMTSASDVVTDLSVPCSSCLTLLSGVNCPCVVDACLGLFPVGALPHYYVVKTLADIATNHPVPFVAKLKEVMSRMTPVIGTIKKLPMKWVFATAYGRFSESMGHYQASCIDAGTVASILPASFEIHMASAFDVMFLGWLQGEKEAKVVHACCESLGHMCLLLDKPALEARVPKLIAAYLTMYRKEQHKDHAHISLGMASALTQAVKGPRGEAPTGEGGVDTLSAPSKSGGQGASPLIAQILATIHPLIARPIDFAHPLTQKNHNELLRCCEILARYDLEIVLQFVIGRFQLKERESRLASLLVIRHFVNALDDLLSSADKKPLLMSSLQTLLGDPDLAVRKNILQLIVSMANGGYLAAEGGEALVKFVLTQCSIRIDGEDFDGRLAPAAGGVLVTKDASPIQLRNAGNHILGVMAAKVPSTHNVIWPYLVELIVAPEFARAIVVIFKVLALVGSMKREDQAREYMIDFDSQVNMPPPQAILCRIMILACEPWRARGEQGATMCRAMQALGPIVHPAVGAYFDSSAPALLAHLDAHSPETMNVAKWQDTLLKMWKETLSLIDDPKWTQDLATVLGEQFKLHKGDSSMLRCVHRYLGSVLARVESRALLHAGIDLMLSNVNHSSDAERQGCAQGLGLAAAVHLDVVLPKLTEKLTPPKVEKKSTGFFGFGGGGSSKDQVLDEKVAATIVLCYGYVSAYANPELIVSRLDVHILHNLVPLLPKARTSLLKLHLIKSIDLIGKAVHSSRLPDAKRTWKLPQRDELLGGMLAFMDDRSNTGTGTGTHAHKESSLELKLLGVNAASTMANLEPPITKETRNKICEVVLPFYGLTAHSEEKVATEKNGNGAKSIAPFSNHPESSEAKDSHSPSSASLLSLLMQNLHVLLASLIGMDPSVSSLVDLLGLLEPWCASIRTVERERSTETTLIILKEFVKKIVHEKLTMPEKKVPKMGAILAGFLARCNDSSIRVRQTSSENVQAIMYIDQILGNPDNTKPAQEVKLVTDIRNRLEEDVSDDRLVVVRDLCSLVTAVVNTNELIATLQGLLAKGVLDADLSAAQGAALIFKTIVYSKCSEMTVAVRPLVTGLLSALKVLRVGEVAEISLAALRVLTRAHFTAVVDQLLESVVPLPREVVDAMTALVETGPTDPSQVQIRPIGMEPEWDEKLAEKTLTYFINVINETPLEKGKPTPIVMTATAAITQMMRVESLKPQIETNYAALFCTLLMRVGTSSGVDKGNSSIDACGAVRAFLDAMCEDALLKKLNSESVWPMLEGAAYDDGMTVVTRCFSSVHPTRKHDLLQFLAKFFSQQSYTGQRIVATAMLAEFVNHASDDVVLLREVIKFLLPRVADKVEKVRKQALRGLGHLVTVWNDETSAMATSVLSSLTAAAEDADADVAAEAVHSLTRIADVVSEDLIGPMLISICFRLRPAFDRKEEKVRGRAFTLFGALHRFGADSNAMSALDGVRSNFLDAVHANLPIFLVHSNDAVSSVRTAAVDGCRQLAPLLGDEFVAILADASPEQSAYDELVQKMCPILNEQHADRLRGYIENTTQYFTSSSTSMRANSAYLAGVIISTATLEQRRTVSIPALTTELLRLLDDPQSSVRARAAKALSLCHHL